MRKIALMAASLAVLVVLIPSPASAQAVTCMDSSMDVHDPDYSAWHTQALTVCKGSLPKVKLEISHVGTQGEAEVCYEDGYWWNAGRYGRKVVAQSWTSFSVPGGVLTLYATQIFRPDGQIKQKPFVEVFLASNAYCDMI